MLYGYEFKWRGGTAAEPQDWRKAYPRTEFKNVNRDNYLEFCEVTAA